MADFDPAAARAAACKRFSERADVAGARRFMRDVQAIRGIERTLQWCTARRLYVSFASCHSGLFEGRDIRVPARYCPATQLFTLLHECGHYLLDSSSASSGFKFGWARAGDAAAHRTWRHRADIVREEVEAWKHGERLARRLKIGLDEPKYDAYRDARLKDYMAWALDDEAERL
jgi:hypothetical protein